jgi:hypothetical protein
MPLIYVFMYIERNIENVIAEGEDIEERIF